MRIKYYGMQILIMWHYILFKSSAFSLTSLAVLYFSFRTWRDIHINMRDYLVKSLLFLPYFNQILMSIFKFY
jgi:hypothetical protein